MTDSRPVVRASPTANLFDHVTADKRQRGSDRKVRTEVLPEPIRPTEYCNAALLREQEYGRADQW